MLKDITLGQFFPGNSLLHRADPRAKIIFSFLFITATFLAENVLGFAVIALVMGALVLMSGISFKTLFKGVKPIFYILIFTFIINIFWYGGEGEPLVSFWIVKIYKEGIFTALLMSFRMVLLVLGTSLVLTYTTSPIMLTDGIEQLLAPLKKIKLPVHEFAMMMTIALRFIPTLIEETEKIMNAQTARGAAFTTGKIMDRAKALIPVLVPLFVSAFKRADDLAVAMECRCYRGGTGRTRMTKLHFSLVDLAFALLFIAMIALIIYLNSFTSAYIFGF